MVLRTQPQARDRAKPLSQVGRLPMFAICSGLSNTCPQVCAKRGAVKLHGQVSNKPTQNRPFVHKLWGESSGPAATAGYDRSLLT